MFMKSAGTRVLFLDYDIEEARTQWFNAFGGLDDSEVLFVSLVDGSQFGGEDGVTFKDSPLRYLTDFEPYIVFVNNDHGEAGQLLKPFFAYNADLLVVVTTDQTFAEMDLGEGRRACSFCNRSVKSLVDAVDDCIPF